MRVLSGASNTLRGFSPDCRLTVFRLSARRDAVLASSTLPERDHATLRALPSNSSEFFGPESAAVFISYGEVEAARCLGANGYGSPQVFWPEEEELWGTDWRSGEKA